TYSAYRHLPIRWRLAGGSAALTLVILCGFAAIVGVLTTRQIHEDFHDDVARSADRLAQQARLRLFSPPSGSPVVRAESSSVNLEDFAASQSAAIRVITEDDTVGYSTPGAPDFGTPYRGTAEIDGWRVESRRVPVANSGPWYLQYARKVSE